jgi:hypothetical protein
VNIKKGLNRVCFVLSVLWVFHVWHTWKEPNVWYLKRTIFDQLIFDWKSFAESTIVGLVLMWGLLYTGFWISSGFSGGEKKKGETDE